MYRSGDLTVTSNTFLGQESSGPRLFHDLIVQKTFAGGFALTGAVDVGYEWASGSSEGGWWGTSFMARQTLSKVFTVNGRVESFADPNGIVVTTASAPSRKFCHPERRGGALAFLLLLASARRVLRATMTKLIGRSTSPEISTTPPLGTRFALISELARIVHLYDC